MRYVAWLWCVLMLATAAILATQARQLGLPAMPNLVLGMIFSATLLLPPLWHRDGLLADLGLPGGSRALLALLLPVACALVGTPFGLDAFLQPPIAA